MLKQEILEILNKHKVSSYELDEIFLYPEEE